MGDETFFGLLSDTHHYFNLTRDNKILDFQGATETKKLYYNKMIKDTPYMRDIWTVVPPQLYGRHFLTVNGWFAKMKFAEEEREKPKFACLKREVHRLKKYELPDSEAWALATIMNWDTVSRGMPSWGNIGCFQSLEEEKLLLTSIEDLDSRSRSVSDGVEKCDRTLEHFRKLLEAYKIRQKEDQEPPRKKSKTRRSTETVGVYDTH